MRGLESRKDAEERVNRLWPMQNLRDSAVPFLGSTLGPGRIFGPRIFLLFHASV